MRTSICVILLVCSTAAAQKPPQQSRPNVPTKLLSRLTHGLSQKQSEDLLGVRGHHQFTATISNSIIRCVSYYRDDVYGHFYLVFTNDSLAKVCSPPPHEMRKVPYEDTVRVQRVLGDPEERIAAVLSAEDLVGPQLSAMRPAKPPKQSADWGLTAAFLSVKRVCNLIPGHSAGEKARACKFSALTEKFDPYQITIGTAVEDVEYRLGEPHITEKYSTGQEIRYYGNVEFGLSGSREMMWLCVVYANGKVNRVFSRDFVDYDKIRPLEESFRKSQ